MPDENNDSQKANESNQTTTQNTPHPQPILSEGGLTYFSDPPNNPQDQTEPEEV